MFRIPNWLKCFVATVTAFLLAWVSFWAFTQPSPLPVLQPLALVGFFINIGVGLLGILATVGVFVLET